ncbi:hypothetical protein E3Q08_00019 [Wallemia mellicola]|uniref:Uncharacterized protein n=1 Tax=Wallemia mellicola TaxID=1708541 RepID=A0AB38N277_9BASI|nr:hypothetical protein E3Q24_03030 [Wallemia mellicola]TIB88381.1 hypothetical protein E3Q21_01030 [Wallemia mellicola]TIB91196.1 hypothetical protein E3Q20_01017 [Wallemia mellicola]TIC40650.1 hypothetical protein E3Q07_02065 [Wallemia mellicola]TIC47317.1 hypothetical protein E3Q08_00019 [Wallemia mellicola]
MTIRNISIFTTEFINGEDDARFRKTLINHSSGSPLYVRSLLKDSSEYAFALRDALSDSHLADVITEAGVSAKKKTINLYQPDSEVGLEYTGTLSFEWTTYFEGHTLQWSKGLLGSIYCSLIRKPDPSVEVCKYVPGNKKSPPTFTILDYNLARFELEDIRGLEIVLLCSVFTFLDMQNQEVGPGEPAKDEPMMTSAVPISAAPAGPALPDRQPSLYEHPRSKLQTIDANTLNISPDLDFEGQVRKTLNMLDGNVFVTLHAPESAAVQTAIRVAESAKRRYMKRPGGMRDDEDLHLYVITDDLLKDRRVSKVYVPPSTLTIHISKWHMPELEEKQQQKRKMMEDSADDIESDPIENTTRVSRVVPSPTTPTNPRMSFINSLNKLRRGVGKV